MPITPFQAEIMASIAANRLPESHRAGGVVLNRAASSPRYSDDFDIFHDLEDIVAKCAEKDGATLLRGGYDLKWEVRGVAFHRAIAYDMDEAALQRDLGPMPRTSLVEGIRKTLTAFLELREEGRLDTKELDG